MLESDCLLVWLKKTFIASILLLCLLIALSKVTEVCVHVFVCMSVCVCVGVSLTEKLYTMSKVKVKYHVSVKISYNKNI